MDDGINRLRACCLCLVSFLVPLQAQQLHAHPEDSATTTYLANEGIMVNDGQTSILFDPLYPQDYGIYRLVPEEMSKDLMAGAAPFDEVDAVFISHMHGDHFSAVGAVEYLQRHKSVRLYAPSQAVELMREATSDEAIFDRVTAISLERLDAPQRFTEGDLRIDVVRIPHAGWPARAEVSNLVWRVTLGDGVTVMHLGDADPNDAHYAPHADHWKHKTTDAAYPPYWFYMVPAGQKILSERLNARSSTGIHVPVQPPRELVDSGEDFFNTPGETRSISHSEHR